MSNTNFTNSQALDELKQSISDDAGYVVGIVDQIMVILMVVGVIYVAGTLISEKSVNKTVISGWFIGLIVWIMVRVILGFTTQ